MRPSRAAIKAAEPAVADAVRNPDAENEKADDQDEESDPEEKQGPAEEPRYDEPERRQPEGADLPCEMAFKVRPLRVAAEDVVQDHCQNGRPRKDEGACNGSARHQSEQDRDGVQAINDVRDDARAVGRFVYPGFHGSSSKMFMP